MSELARDIESSNKPKDQYKPACDAFCDGIEFKLGRIPKKIVAQNVQSLLLFINRNMTELMFKHVMASERSNRTYLWLTLQPNTTTLTPRTLVEFKKTLEALQKYAKLDW